MAFLSLALEEFVGERIKDIVTVACGTHHDELAKELGKFHFHHHIVAR